MRTLSALLSVLGILILTSCGEISLGSGVDESGEIPPEAMDKMHPNVEFVSAEVLLNESTFKFVWTLAWYDLEEFQGGDYKYATWIEVWSDELRDYRSTERIVIACEDERVVCNEGESIVVTSNPLKISEEMYDGTWMYWIWAGDVSLSYIIDGAETSEVVPFPESYSAEN